MPELAEPDKGLGVVYLLMDEFGHNVSSMNVDCTDGHDPLPVALGHVSQQKVDEGVQLSHLLLVVVFQGILIAFL